jgi:hypothetical protein
MVTSIQDEMDIVPTTGIAKQNPVEISASTAVENVPLP